MNAPQTPPVGASSRPAPRFSLRSPGYRTLVLYLITALLVTGTVLFLLGSRSSEPVPEPERTEPVRQPLPPIAAPEPPPAPPESPHIDRLDERIIELSRSFEALEARYSAIEAHLVASDEHNNDLRAQLEGLANPPRPAPAPARRPVATKPAKPRMPTVLSIDTWGSEPSVAIRGLQGGMAFYREGDVVGVARIERIDPQARRVHLRSPDGTLTAIGVQH
ncbi:MAG: hypothetical protein ROZ37_15665 [Aromatoleum sp.]|jgi:hypothetical protein|uniref:hypothetical protein n=1 Tax=Aromatoleum sp. TaxID=2307007 RepID=UPI0028945014|nr:hypothetical protein [Aromatoleum sp.]MDT3671753.1 hypothetical protein [Aromatoleum sp.]